MWQKYVLAFVTLFTLSKAQRITTIQLDGIQYFISRMNPYTPELNYFMAYQYCRSIGLQLSSFESKEKSDSITQYLTNAGYNKYDFWTSGNRIGTDMFLWMSTGLPFNATFNLMKAQEENQPLLGTMPLGRKKRLDSGISDACVALKSPDLIWDTEDCTSVKDFICEQTRCYYYNYGSIPVSSSQGNRTASSSNKAVYSTPLPLLSTASPSTTIASIYSSTITTAANSLFNQEEENGAEGGDDYFNENNYVRILNNYRKVTDEHENEESKSGPEVPENVAAESKQEKIEKIKETITKSTAENEKNAVGKDASNVDKNVPNVNKKQDKIGHEEFVVKKGIDKDDLKENVNKRSEYKGNQNRMDIKETIMKNIQNKINDKQAGSATKNVYKKNTIALKTEENVSKKPELTNGINGVTDVTPGVTLKTGEVNEKKTNDPDKTITEIKKIEPTQNSISSKIEPTQKHGELKVSNTIVDKNAKKDVNKDNNVKTSETIINNIKNIMNNSNKTPNSEIHDTQILVKNINNEVDFKHTKSSDDKKINGKIEDNGKEDNMKAHDETVDILDDYDAKFNVFNGNVASVENDGKGRFRGASRHGAPIGVNDEERVRNVNVGEDDKTRLRNTKVLEPTENNARNMPEDLTNAFPWSWAKDILLEKPVAKKTNKTNDGEDLAQPEVVG